MKSEYTISHALKEGGRLTILDVEKYIFFPDCQTVCRPFCGDVCQDAHGSGRRLLHPRPRDSERQGITRKEVSQAEQGRLTPALQVPDPVNLLLLPSSLIYVGNC